jgi:predicted RecB family nuclease
MKLPQALTDDILLAFLQCNFKAYLKLRGEAGETSNYQRTQDRLAAAYKVVATEGLLRRHEGQLVVQGPPSLPDALQSGAALITDVVASEAGESCHMDALEKHGSGPDPMYRPVLLIRREKLTANDRLLLAYSASVLGRLQGTRPLVGRIVHGKDFSSSRVELPTLEGAVSDAIGHITDMIAAKEPPQLILNRHCSECEFRSRCSAAANEKDDLSLLTGMSVKEITALNARGIFTVRQYSYTFRPARMKRAKAKKHDHSLQALAVRENTIYVATRPDLVEAKTVLYLDVEGLPDEGLYYLLGLTVVEGENRRHLCFWADSELDEPSIWAAFQAAIEGIEDFVLFHYGSYETKFLERMEARYGGNAAVLARIKKSSANVLSLIYSRIYFPVHSNDLKSVVGCLGFRWSDTNASGLQSIAWRHRWEATRSEAVKQQLVTYNEEDCQALERVVQMLRSLGGQRELTGEGGGPRIAGVEEVEGPYRHRYGTPKFALPEFARLTKCAYFDYQRYKVLCRTSRRVNKVGTGKKKWKRPAWKVNREVEWGRPAACPHCGSAGLDTQTRTRKLVIDLKLFRGGLKREVTRHKACRYRCRKCLETFLPPGYLAMSPVQRPPRRR